MDPQQRTLFEDRARIIKAMGHATRLFMVHELENGEMCVCDLQAKVGADISTVSRHLSILKQAGIITSRKQGNQVFYSLQCPCVLSFFQCVETVLQQNQQRTLQQLES